MEGFKKKGCGSSHSDCTQGMHYPCAFPGLGQTSLHMEMEKKQARSMHCHSHGDLRSVLGAVAVESDLDAGDYISFLLQSELNQAVVD